MSESFSDAGSSTASDVLSIGTVDHRRRRAIESITTLADGRVGWRGLSEACDSPARPGTRVAGIYDEAGVSDLLPGPIGTTVRLRPEHGWTESVELDLAGAVLTTTLTRPDAVVVVTRFASAARQGLLGLRVEGPVANVADGAPLRSPSLDVPGVRVTLAPDGTVAVGDADQAIVAAADQVTTDDGDRRMLTRLVVAAGGDDEVAVRREVREQLGAAVELGYEHLLAEHRRVWARRRQTGTVELNGDPNLERCLRFAHFHLLSAASGNGEVAIGARGLTGSAYRGHVFWDTDVFVVPALCGLDPAAARSALVYRWNRLPAARQLASAAGREGARFPWESAHFGTEETPPEVVDLRGRTIQVLTGALEDHIVADVAWAVDTYRNWTDDSSFMSLAGEELIADTARYWASRVRLGSDGRYHIDGVIGPDEYHEDVDDNAYTNLLARHNLRLAVDLPAASRALCDAEREQWADIAARMFDCFDRATSTHEQFANFQGLEPRLARDVGDPPFSADVVLGHDAIQHTQIIKQADVLMLHHMIPEDLPSASLEADLDRYLPLTAHGSSLSPAVHAGLLARVGRADEALELFRLAARLDLDDLTGTTAGGVHLATMGGLWQAFVNGFLGLRPSRAGIVFDPRVPARLGRVQQRLRWRGTVVTVVVDDERAGLRSTADVRVLPSDDEAATASRFEFRRTEHGWRLR